MCGGYGGAWAQSDDLPQLALPVACQPGVSCVVQNYVDRGGGAPQDFACGAMTYQGHDGTDFRLPFLPSRENGVAVLAALDGQVKAVRDGMADGLFLTGGRAAVAGKECGNGLVIDHGRGWTTQYCHLLRDSVQVKAGDRVQAGQKLGLIGLSGMSEFAHVHLTVRQHGKAVDPFAVHQKAETCGVGVSLWRSEVASRLAYASPFLLNAGFVGREITAQQIELGEAERAVPSNSDDVLAAYVRIIGLKKGDEQSLIVTTPQGEVLARSLAKPLPSHKAQYMMLAGRKKPADGWPLGKFRAVYQLKRQNAVVIDKVFEVELR